MFPQYKTKFDELKEASKPLLEFLHKYYDPMTSITITEGYIKVQVTDMSMPLEIRD